MNYFFKNNKLVEYGDINKENIITIPKKKERDSNLELYRIIVMLAIVAHHYVVNSGLIEMLKDAPFSTSSYAMLLFGAWGKTGINCFVLITGYFICRMSFTWQKLLKLYMQIVFYAVVIYAIFCITGHETLSISKAVFKLFSVKSLTDGFTSCFIVFYLFIPFLNILIRNMDKKQHKNLVLLLIVVYTILPSIRVQVSLNYVVWFTVLYFIASYVRLYRFGAEIRVQTWGIISIVLIFAGAASVLAMVSLYKLGYVSTWSPYWFISDSNKLLSLLIGIATFMWFKNLRIPQSKMINAIGSTTFGVLLIHANSDAMRQWLWRDTIDSVGHWVDSVLCSVGYATLSVILTFSICSIIEFIRSRYLVSAIMGLVSRIKIKLI